MCAVRVSIITNGQRPAEKQTMPAFSHLFCWKTNVDSKKKPPAVSNFPAAEEQDDSSDNCLHMERSLSMPAVRLGKHTRGNNASAWSAIERELWGNNRNIEYLIATRDAHRVVGNLYPFEKVSTNTEAGDLQILPRCHSLPAMPKVCSHVCGASSAIF